MVLIVTTHRNGNVALVLKEVLVTVTAARKTVSSTAWDSSSWHKHKQGSFSLVVVVMAVAAPAAVVGFCWWRWRWWWSSSSS